MRKPKSAKKVVKKENIKLIAFTDEAMEVLQHETGSGDASLTVVVNNIISGRDLLNPVAESLIKQYQEIYKATRKQALEALVLQSFAARQIGGDRQK